MNRYNIFITIIITIISSCRSDKTTSNETTISTDINNNQSSDSINLKQNELNQEIITSDTIINFANTVFEFGEKAHLTDSCSFYFECDCCYGDFVFKPDFTFYYIDHCMADITVTRGSYSLQENYLILNSDSIKAEEAYNRENESDSSAIDYILSDSTIKPYTLKFAIQSCQSRIKLIDTEDPSYVALLTKRKASSEMSKLESKGILERFNTLDKKK